MEHDSRCQVTFVCNLGQFPMLNKGGRKTPPGGRSPKRKKQFLDLVMGYPYMGSAQLFQKFFQLWVVGGVVFGCIRHFLKKHVSTYFRWTIEWS